VTPPPEGTESDSSEPQRPLLRVIHGGEPTAEETAALVMAVTLLSSSGAGSAEPAPSRWASREAALRRPLHPGPGAWVASARP
jgi:hypothetical protein